MIDELIEILPTPGDQPYLSVFALTHPDLDHCQGFEEFETASSHGVHLHKVLCDDTQEVRLYCFSEERAAKERAIVERFANKRVIISELWMSPRTFREFRENDDLCDDAQAFHDEAFMRRVEAAIDAATRRPRSR